MQSLCVAFAAAAAVMAHLNTLPADFAFDDNFAIVSPDMSCMAYAAVLLIFVLSHDLNKPHSDDPVKQWRCHQR